MGKKLRTTPRSVIKSAFRQVWMRSRERSEALKRTGYCCEKCHVKQSRAKGREVYVEVHHMDGIDWPGLVDLFIERVLHDPSRLMPLCEKCHDEVHKEVNSDAQ
jgi:predicted HNH restriction endonuclease